MPVPHSRYSEIYSDTFEKFIVLYAGKRTWCTFDILTPLWEFEFNTVALVCDKATDLGGSLLKCRIKELQTWTETTVTGCVTILSLGLTQWKVWNGSGSMCILSSQCLWRETKFFWQSSADLWLDFLPLTKVLMVAARPFIKAPSLRRLRPNDVNGETRRVRHSFSHSLSAHNWVNKLWPMTQKKLLNRKLGDTDEKDENLCHLVSVFPPSRTQRAHRPAIGQR